jgi:hypothetical protein
MSRIFRSSKKQQPNVKEMAESGSKSNDKAQMTKSKQEHRVESGSLVLPVGIEALIFIWHLALGHLGLALDPSPYQRRLHSAQLATLNLPPAFRAIAMA